MEPPTKLQQREEAVQTFVSILPVKRDRAQKEKKENFEKKYFCFAKTKG
jgi:hypothetical protein